MQKYIAPIVVAGAVVLAGCASIVSKSEYPVAITSNPTGADFTVKRANGLPIASGVTPATITLAASDGYFKPAKYTVEFRRKGVLQSVPLTAKVDGWYFGNILFGGLIGLLIVDPATGAMWSLKDTAIATFQQTADAAPANRRALQIADINSLPMKYQGQLVALN